MFIKLKNLFYKRIPIILIDSESEFDKTLVELSLEKIIGIDTEFDWRNTYFPKLSLIQISTNKKIFLIDCMKLNSLFKFQSIFEDKDIVKVFHAARSDTTVLFCSADT